MRVQHKPHCPPWERIPEVPHQDRRHGGDPTAEIQAVLDRILPESLGGIQRHGNATIPAEALAAIAMLCWGWISEGTIEERIAAACDILKRVGRVDAAVSRQGVMQALASCSTSLLPAMTDHLAEQVQQLKGHWTILMFPERRNRRWRAFTFRSRPAT